MVARDNQAGVTTNPVNYKTEKVDGVERIVPSEPHIGTTINTEPKEATVQTGYARGGTSRPAEGQSGEVEQLDNTGKPVKEHPGEIARIVREDGSQAGLDALNGKVPPGDPEPKSAGKKKG